MLFKASKAHHKSDVLQQVFAGYASEIAEALGHAGIGLEKDLSLHRNAFLQVVEDLDRHEAHLKDKRLRKLYGIGANVLHLVAVPIMTHLPVSPCVFLEENTEYGRRLANALYAIAVAFTYLEIHTEDADEVIRRLATYLMASHAPGKVEANLAALRGFLDAYVQEKLFVGPRVLRERFAIA